MKPTDKIVDLIYQIATGSVKTKILLTPIVATIYLSLIVAFIFFALIADSLFNFPRIDIFSWNLFIALSLFVFGFILMLFTIIYFIKAKGTPVPLNPPKTLIVAGPYRLARNPMLTGIFLQLLGIGFYYHSTSLIFIFTPLFILINYLELKYIEEPEMEKRFGQDFRDYKKRTPMFIPLLSCAKRSRVKAA